MLAGIEQPGYSLLLWSLGHHEAEHAAVIVRHLRSVFDSERWGQRKISALISLCVGELSDGYALDASQRLTDAARQRWIGCDGPCWYRRWRSRYESVMDECLEQIAIAQIALGPRMHRYCDDS